MRTKQWISEGGQRWWIRLHSETRTPDGKRRSWTRTLRERPTESVRDWIAKTLPVAFRGCRVDVTTPLHHDVCVVDPDWPHECKYVG